MNSIAVTDLGGLYCPVRMNQTRSVIDCNVSHLPQSYALHDLLALDEHDLSFATQSECLAVSLQHLIQSDTARLLINEAEDNGWALTISSENTDVVIDHTHFTAIIPLGAPSLSVYARQSFRHAPFTMMVLKALRMIWHTENPTPEAPLIPSALLLKKRIMAADISCITLITAWELRALGQTDLWRTLMAGDTSDLAMMLADDMEMGEYEDVTQSLSHLFYEWFWDDERLQAHDRIALDDLDAGMAANDRLFAGQMDIKVTDVTALTTLFDGQSYAASFAPELVTNSFYRRIPDLTNRIHFDQVMDDYQLMQVDLSFRDPYLAEIFKTGRQADILV